MQPSDLSSENVPSGDRGTNARQLLRLGHSERVSMLSQMEPQDGASLLHVLPPAVASSVLEELSPAVAAAILNYVPSDEQADLISEFNSHRAELVLGLMDPNEAADVAVLRRYAPDTAGGLMLREFLTASAHETAADVVRRLQENAASYANFPVQYLYVISPNNQLVGVVQIRDLLFVEGTAPITAKMVESPSSVSTNATVDELRDFFDRYTYLAAPVVTPDNELVGIVPREVLEEAIAARSAQTFLRFSGIVGGEEYRTMPVLARSAGRLVWLSATLVLNLLAASVIGAFEHTLSAVVALAAFLPVISGMSGNAGNQAIAVSMREMSLGLLKPHELRWVISKEAVVASVNGLVLGLLIGLAAMLWKQNIYFGLVIGVAQALMVLTAACLGGSLPLVLRRLHIDPALATAPLMTAIIDACGFFVTLSFARLMLPWLT